MCVCLRVYACVRACVSEKESARESACVCMCLYVYVIYEGIYGIYMYIYEGLAFACVGQMTGFVTGLWFRVQGSGFAGVHDWRYV
jgi:cytochrome b561